MPNQSKIAIIGAGPLGLSAAYFLSRKLPKSCSIVVIEKASCAGGLAFSHQLSNGEALECYYHHIFASDSAFLGLLDDLALLGEIFFKKASLGHFYQGKLYYLNDPLDVLSTHLLSPLSRLRFLWASAYLKTGIQKFFSGLTALEGCKRLYGSEVTEKIWGPLLQGKFGAYEHLVPMSWIASRIRDRTIKLGYMHGGFHRFYDYLQKACEHSNVNFKFSESVSSISVGTSSVLVDGVAYDACLSTIGPLFDRKVLASSAGEAFKYLGAVCVVYELTEDPLIPYWTNYSDKDSPVLAVINHRELEGDSRFGELFPVYSAAYLEPDSLILNLSDDQIIDEFFKAVVHVSRGSGASVPLQYSRATVYRSEYAQPLINPAIGLNPVQDLTGPFYRASMHSVFPNDRGQNYAVALGARVADKIAADLS